MKSYSALRLPKEKWGWPWGDRFGKYVPIGGIGELQEFTKDKSIALVGNATSIFKNKKDIDKHDIICRIHKTFPPVYETIYQHSGEIRDKTDDPIKAIPHMSDEHYYNYKEYIGSRTEILFGSSNTTIPVMDTKYFVWCTYHLAPQIKRFYPNLKTPFILFGQKEWYELEAELDARPVTGTISFYFLVKHINFKDLTLYGFDWWETPDWRETKTGVMDKTVHDYNTDKDYVLQTIKCHSNIKRVVD